MHLSDPTNPSHWGPPLPLEEQAKLNREALTKRVIEGEQDPIEWYQVKYHTPAQKWKKNLGMGLVFTEINKREGGYNEIHTKTLHRYKLHFHLKDPYKVMVGPYFAQYARNKKMNLQIKFDHLFMKKPFDLYTTQCCIDELQSKISNTKGMRDKSNVFVRGIAFLHEYAHILPCLHKKKKKEDGIDNNDSNHSNQEFKGKFYFKRWQSINVMKCLKPYMMQPEYFFALQSVALLSRVRGEMGVPTIWIKDKTFVLDRPSVASILAVRIRSKKLAAKKKSEKEEKGEDGRDGDDAINSKNKKKGNYKQKKSIVGDFMGFTLPGKLKHQQNELNGNQKKSKKRKRTFEEMEHLISYTENGGYDTRRILNQIVTKKRKKENRTKENKRKKIKRILKTVDGVDNDCNSIKLKEKMKKCKDSAVSEENIGTKLKREIREWYEGGTLKLTEQEKKPFIIGIDHEHNTNHGLNGFEDYDQYNPFHQKPMISMIEDEESKCTVSNVAGWFEGKEELELKDGENEPLSVKEEKWNWLYQKDKGKELKGGKYQREEIAEWFDGKVDKLDYDERERKELEEEHQEIRDQIEKEEEHKVEVRENVKEWFGGDDKALVLNEEEREEIEKQKVLDQMEIGLENEIMEKRHWWVQRANRSGILNEASKCTTEIAENGKIEETAMAQNWQTDTN